MAAPTAVPGAAVPGQFAPGNAGPHGSKNQGPYKWAVTSGSLPAGLTLSLWGVIKGTPTTLGTSSFTLTATDAAGNTASHAYSITISAPALAITTSQLAAAVAGQPYTTSLKAAGGVPPYTWAVTVGTLPSGLALTTGGVLTGTATGNGSFTFTVQVTDSASTTAQAVLVLPVVPILVPVSTRPLWHFVVTNAMPDGTLLVELPRALNRQLTVYSDSSQADQAVIAADGDRPETLFVQELATDLVVYRDGTRLPLFRGRVMPTQDDWPDGTFHQLTVTANDYRTVLGRRRLYSADTLAYTTTDTASIAWSLVQATQGHPGGQLGIAQGVSQPTGNALTITFTNQQFVGDEITQMSQMTPGGFDWAVSPSGDTALKLDVWSPGRGTSRGVVLEQGGGLIAPGMTRVFDPTAYLNAALVTGDSSVALTAQAVSNPNIATLPQGLWDQVIGTNVLTQAALNSLAAFYGQQGEVITPTYTVPMQPGSWQGPHHIWVGDTVRLRISSGRLQVDDDIRVVAIGIQVDSSERETVTLTLGQIPFDPRWAIPRMLRRLRFLEAHT